MDQQDSVIPQQGNVRKMGANQQTQQRRQYELLHNDGVHGAARTAAWLWASRALQFIVVLLTLMAFAVPHLHRVYATSKKENVGPLTPPAFLTAHSDAALAEIPEITKCGVIVTAFNTLGPNCPNYYNFPVFTNTLQVRLANDLLHISGGGRNGGTCLVLCDGVSLDGRNFVMEGPIDAEDFSIGIEIQGKNVSVRNLIVKGFDFAIFARHAKNLWMEAITSQTPQNAISVDIQIYPFSNNVTLSNVSVVGIIISDTFGFAIKDSFARALSVSNSTGAVQNATLGMASLSEKSTVSMYHSVVQPSAVFGLKDVGLQISESVLGLGSTSICGSTYKDIFISTVDHTLSPVFFMDGNVTCGTTEQGENFYSDLQCDKPCP